MRVRRICSVLMVTLLVFTAPVYAGIGLAEYEFTRAEGVTLHYFGVGDKAAIKSETAISGSLVIVGGALKPDNAAVYNRFIELAGGKENAKIAIMPTASASPATSAGYMKTDFITYGVPEANIYIVPVAVKNDSDTEEVDESAWSQNGFSQEVADSLSGYTGIWFVGGWQDRITQSLLNADGSDGPVLTAIKSILENGGVIAGTSAGAAIMSDPMLNGGTSMGALTREIITEDMGADDPRLFIAKGIGFFPFGLTDQHFIARGRFGRLLAACKKQNIPMGFGIEENTAMVVTGKSFEVVGVEASRSGVVVIDLNGQGIENYTIYEKRASGGTRGYEYESGNRLHSDIFSANTLVDQICEGLVDNEKETAQGVAFEMADDVNAIGVRVTFSKTPWKADDPITLTDTQGFYGKIDGVYTYSAVNVKLSVEPIALTIQGIDEAGNVTCGLPYKSAYDKIQWGCRESDTFYCIDILDENWNFLHQAAKCGEDLHSFSPKDELDLGQGKYNWKVWSPSVKDYAGYQLKFEGGFTVP